MNADRWEEVQAVFDELVELDPNERAKRLATIAIKDPELHRALESLLEADAHADAKLASIDAVLLTGSARRARLSAALADRYRIEREIGRGGMATVYLARDLKHDRDVALKVLRPELAAALGVNRFLNEIRISAKLDHPHILTLIDSGAAEGFLYYVMPFVRGESLRDRLKRDKQLKVDEAVDIAKQVTSALDYAHRQGLVHRDIKPENILLHEGEAVLADFGIAMAVKEAGGSRLTESGISLGTPQYMSPEQATGDRSLDARSDVYSIAAVLYEMLAGEPPHTGASVHAIIAKLLTEQPTRLRVIRDTVPLEVDSAVAKALAKLPTDRYATAGDFARALTTPGVPRQATARVRRWVPIALGGALATLAAIAAALVFTRAPAARPLADRVQLTLTGNAIAPSLSRDGTRLAFAEKQCDSVGACTYQVVIQDADGTGRLVIARNIGWLFKTQWTSDGRFLLFAGSYPPQRVGSFAVSTLGGEPRYLCSCTFDLPGGDTAFLADPGWMRRITVHDGQTLDSIPIREQEISSHTIALSIPDRLIAVGRRTPESAPELRLTDFRGQVLNRVAASFWSREPIYPRRWVPSRQKLVVASRRELGGSVAVIGAHAAIGFELAGTEFDILAMNVTRVGIEPDIDTVFSGLQIHLGMFDISADGERLVYSAGPVESSVSMIDIDAIPRTRLAATQLLPSTTTLLRGRISPAGDKVFLARDAPRAGSHASQLSIIPRTGGAESPIPGAVENLLDFQWSPDGARIMYLLGLGGNKIRLMERDTSGRQPREIRLLEQPGANLFQPLPDGAVCLIAGRSISIIHRPDKRDTTWNVPGWIPGIGSISRSPDAKSLAVEGMDRSQDSVVVATMDIESGHFTRIGIFAGSDPQKIAWLADGSIMVVFRQLDGAWVFYRIPPGQPAQRLGTLPHTRADFSVSNDGRHVAMFSYSDKNDVYMIRNFGKMLRR